MQGQSCHVGRVVKKSIAQVFELTDIYIYIICEDGYNNRTKGILGNMNILP